MPVFGVPGNRDAEALAKLKEVFPNKTIETIDYNEVALQGGILNCTTWVMRE
jgi:agmatine deiminase